MSAIHLNTEENAAIALQRTFRHRRYLKRVEALSEEYKRPLSVRDIDPKEDQVVKTLRSWSSVFSQDDFGRFMDSEEQRDEVLTKMQAMGLYNMMADCLESNRSSDRKWIGTFDKQGVLQALAIYETPSLDGSVIHLSYIVSAPANLSRKSVSVIRGAATALIERLIHIARKLSNQNPKLIDLTCTWMAQPFYQKLLFEWNEDQMIFYDKSVPEFFKKHSGRVKV